MTLRGRKVMVIVYRERPFRVLLLRRPDRAGEWHPVTGHVEGEEGLEAAARREVGEETGLAGELESLAIAHRFEVPSGPFAGEYEERAFAIRVEGGEPRLSREHDAYAWLGPEEAASRLVWPTQRDALRALAARRAATS